MNQRKSHSVLRGAAQGGCVAAAPNTPKPTSCLGFSHSTSLLASQPCTFVPTNECDKLALTAVNQRRAETCAMRLRLDEQFRRILVGFSAW